MVVVDENRYEEIFKILEGKKTKKYHEISPQALMTENKEQMNWEVLGSLSFRKTTIKEETKTFWT